MEKKETRNITSNPRATDSDSDNLTDFEEFMNGSDPTRSDTDGDTVLDWWEIHLKSNITGIDGTPPQISNVKLDIGIDWGKWGILYLPLWSHVTVSFDVSDAVGLWNLQVTLFRMNGRVADAAPLKTWAPGATETSFHFSWRWDISIVEAFAAGADVNISAEDVNGNMAWGQFHIKSIMEQAAAFIAAMFAAIAKFIAEAASAAINWIWGAINVVMSPIVVSIVAAARSWIQGLDSVLNRATANVGESGAVPADFSATFLAAMFLNPLTIVLAAVVIVILVFGWIVEPFLLLFHWLVLAITLAVGAILLSIVASAVPPTTADTSEAPPTSAAGIGAWMSSAVNGMLEVPSAPLDRADHSVFLAGVIVAAIIAVIAGLVAESTTDISGTAATGLGLMLFVMGFLISLYLDATAPPAGSPPPSASNREFYLAERAIIFVGALIGGAWGLYRSKTDAQLIVATIAMLAGFFGLVSLR